MKDTVEGAARDVENSIQTNASDFEKSWAEATDTASSAQLTEGLSAYPEYRHPQKKWRVKQGAMPNWYKARTGTRTKALSGAARVARYRPQKLS
jgi:sec-independent protein translocase protein TatB